MSAYRSTTMAESMDMELQEVLSYQGDPICALNEETMMFASGNTLVFRGMRPGQAPSFYRSEADGGRAITAVGANWKTGVIAYSARGNFPTIKVLSAADKKLVATLSDGTDLEYACVAFNREGNRLLGVGKLTDYVIVCVYAVVVQRRQGGGVECGVLMVE